MSKLEIFLLGLVIVETIVISLFTCILLQINDEEEDD